MGNTKVERADSANGDVAKDDTKIGIESTRQEVTREQEETRGVIEGGLVLTTIWKSAEESEDGDTHSFSETSGNQKGADAGVKDDENKAGGKEQRICRGPRHTRCMHCFHADDRFGRSWRCRRHCAVVHGKWGPTICSEDCAGKQDEQEGVSLEADSVRMTSMRKCIHYIRPTSVESKEVLISARGSNHVCFSMRDH